MTVRRRLLVLAGLLLVTHCVVRGRVGVKPLPLTEETRVATPVKAHLADGSTIVYAAGVSVKDGTLIGMGKKFDLTLTEAGDVEKVPLESVMALEVFENQTNREATVLASGASTFLVTIGTAVLLKALFGSCPTVYSTVDGSRELEAELFSVSIAPSLEMPDVDRLRVQPDRDGFVELEVRNEALETHYINHLEIVEIHHDPAELVVPDHLGRPVALSRLFSPGEIVDRRGRDLRPVLEAADGVAFATDAELVKQVAATDFHDAIEMRIPLASGQEEIALALRLRNSLLNTVLFYETILKRSGPRSLDWLGTDLADPEVARELAAWYSSRMGMRVAVWRDGEYHEIAHVRDSGPVAWRDVAVVLPVGSAEGDLRVRLSFVADNWRIDRIQIAAGVRRPVARPFPATELTAIDGTPDLHATASVSAADHQYLRTVPGQAFRARFHVGGEGPARTYFLRSSGYYTEWIRAPWVNTRPSTAFRPSDEALVEALAMWRNVQVEYESRFDTSRIPTR